MTQSLAGIGFPGAVAPASRRAARWVAALCLALGSSGCLLTTKTAEGRALHDAPEILARAQSIDVSLTASSRLVRQGSLTTVPGPDPGFKVTGVVDLASEQAVYKAAGRTVALERVDREVRHRQVIALRDDHQQRRRGDERQVRAGLVLPEHLDAAQRALVDP